MQKQGLNQRKNKPDWKKQIEAMQKIIKDEPIKKRKEYVRTKTSNDMREKRLESKILFTLNTYDHIIVWKNGEMANYNSRWIMEGMPDIGGFNLKDKYLFFIEVKEGNGKQRDSQASFEGLCTAVGVRYYLVYSVSEAENLICR